MRITGDDRVPARRVRRVHGPVVGMAPGEQRGAERRDGRGDGRSRGPGFQPPAGPFGRRPFAISPIVKTSYAGSTRGAVAAKPGAMRRIAVARISASSVLEIPNASSLPTAAASSEVQSSGTNDRPHGAVPAARSSASRALTPAAHASTSVASEGRSRRARAMSWAPSRAKSKARAPRSAGMEDAPKSSADRPSACLRKTSICARRSRAMAYPPPKSASASLRAITWTMPASSRVSTTGA